jgi:hypothetical protein
MTGFSFVVESNDEVGGAKVGTFYAFSRVSKIEGRSISLSQALGHPGHRSG